MQYAEKIYFYLLYIYAYVYNICNKHRTRVQCVNAYTTRKLQLSKLTIRILIM